jgi:hypothetical protein
MTSYSVQKLLLSLLHSKTMYKIHFTSCSVCCEMWCLTLRKEHSECLKGKVLRNVFDYNRDEVVSGK